MTSLHPKNKHNDNWRLVQSNNSQIDAQSDRSQIEDENIIPIEDQRSPKRFRFCFVVAILAIVSIFLVGFFVISPKLASGHITNLNQKNSTSQYPQGQDPKKGQNKDEFLPKKESSNKNKTITLPPQDQGPHKTPNGTQKLDSPIAQPPPVVDSPKEASSPAVNPPKEADTPVVNPPKEANPPQEATHTTTSVNPNFIPKDSAPLSDDEAGRLCRARGWPVHPKGPGPTRRKIYDLFIIRDEIDSLEIRLGQMWGEVDYFIIVESPQAFTGAPKNLTLLENWDRFKPFHSKIIRHTLNLTGTNLSITWKREDFQRNAMYYQVVPFLEGPQKIEQGDVILVSDVDELIRNEVLRTLRACDFPKKLVLMSQFFYYAFEFLHQGEEWPHPEATWYDGNNTVSPQELRTERWNPSAARYPGAGWHCSYCFGKLDDIVGKLNTFSHQEYNHEEFNNRSKILYRVVNGLDLFKSPWSIYRRIINNQDIPEYVKENREKFIYLIDRPAPTGNFIDFTESDACLLK